MRRVIAFECAGETLVGTLDEADATTGLLIVSGGNEIRAGAHRSMAALAQRLAKTGIPVFRYDRRGVGDSTGANAGFELAADDLTAAVKAFKSLCPHVTHIVGFGNCDAATTLALFHRQAGIDSLVLANPWTIETPDALPPAAAIRARYVERLRDPATYVRLLRGGIDLRKLAKGLGKLSKTPDNSSNNLAVRLGRSLVSTDTPARIVLARGDATAIAFGASAAGGVLPADFIETNSHSFAAPEDQVALESLLRSALAAA
ncbi:hydrolase 1, exosortase A system-associated [Sphingomonas aliaeris]|uniref:Hydrolase 1, exosortase A system-associated n=1 Tax=Sphingomonas aliaeris TaxID=2759526 RepID=A0A974NWL6_9SPHN|nr:hydrolase 1, exosortase A system-associated [Sphingomonas aliaeris]QQV78213.1 hydrolase 1, exosortase A system-associated [Sphingomonas aliaeris]